MDLSWELKLFQALNRVVLKKRLVNKSSSYILSKLKTIILINNSFILSDIKINIYIRIML